MSFNENDEYGEAAAHAMERRFLYGKLSDLAGKNELAELYCEYEHGGGFFVGWIIEATEDDVLIASVNASGGYDGFFCLMLDDMTRLALETRYLGRLTRLIGSREQFRRFTGASGEPLSDLVLFAMKHSLCVSITIVDNPDSAAITGLIRDLSDEMLEVAQYDRFGAPDGTVFIRLADIRKLVCDSYEEAIQLRLIGNKPR